MKFWTLGIQVRGFRLGIWSEEIGVRNVGGWAIEFGVLGIRLELGVWVLEFWSLGIRVLDFVLGFGVRILEFGILEFRN